MVDGSTQSGWEVFDELVRGNCRFQIGKPHHTGKNEEAKQAQRKPVAAILGCGDPGADYRRALDMPVGDGGIFLVKNAGARYTGSHVDDFALIIEKAGISLIAVISHTDCAALNATCQHLYHDSSPRALGIVRDLRPAFERTAREGDTGTPAHVERATRSSALWNARLVREDARIAGVTGSRGERAKILVVAGEYNLMTKRIEFLGKQARLRQHAIYTELGLEWPFATITEAEASTAASEAAG